MKYFAYFMTSMISGPLSTAGFKQHSANELTSLEHTAFKMESPLQPVVSVMLESLHHPFPVFPSSSRNKVVQK